MNTTCKHCNKSVEVWLGGHDYCFTCLNDKEAMNEEFVKSIEPLEPEPQAVASSFVQNDEPLELDEDNSAERYKWNAHLGQYEEFQVE